MNRTDRNAGDAHGNAPTRLPGGTTDRATLTAIARRAMIEAGMEPDFPPAAQQEVAAMSRPADANGSVRDLRDRLWASIDNDDSRDLDQLTVAEPLAGGQVRILVAVADVDALVRRDSAIDRHASNNTTSVYTPAVVFAMLPEALSTNLTSLNEDQDRIAVVADMVFDGNGLLGASDLYRARVRNHGQLAYRSVAAWLEGQGAAPPRVVNTPGLAENLRLQDTVAQRLADLRHRHGALSLETIEAKAVFDGDALSALDSDRKSRATQLIEDFMIAANGVTATYLESKGFPSLRRVLRLPERWDRIVNLASGIGERLPASPDAPALEVFLGGQAHRQGRVRGRPARGRTARTLRAGGEGLHPLYGAEPALSGSPDAAAPEGGHGGLAAALYHPGTDGIRDALHHPRRRRDEGGTAGEEVGGRAAAVGQDWRILRRHRHRRVPERHVGANRPASDRRQSGARISGARRGRPGSRQTAPDRRRAGVHRLRPRLTRTRAHILVPGPARRRAPPSGVARRVGEDRVVERPSAHHVAFRSQELGN